MTANEPTAVHRPGLIQRITSALRREPARQRREAVLNELAQKAKQEFISLGTDSTDVKRRVDSLRETLDGYPTGTLVVINESFSNSETGLATFIHRTGKHAWQGAIRTVAHYRLLPFYYDNNFHPLLEHVRDSLGVRDLTLLPRGTDEYRAAYETILVAISASKNYENVWNKATEKEETLGHSREEAQRIAFREINDTGANAFMTHELARVIRERPGESERIISYLESKMIMPKDVDPELLLMHLDLEAKVLVDGLL